MPRLHGYGSVDVDIENIFHTTHDRFKGMLHTHIETKQGYEVLKGVNSWLFNERDMNCKQYKNLVVIWRTKFIEGNYPIFKDSYDSSYWDLIIPLLKLAGFTVAEVTHRTPISEVYHLISSARLVVAYNGMYHYISKNFIKPMIVMGDSGIIKTHSPQAKHFFAPHKDKSEREILDYILDIRDNLPELDRRVVKVKQKLYPIIYGKDYA